MTYQATVKGGKLELEQPLSLPDGTVVQVEIVPEQTASCPEDDTRVSHAGEQWLEEWRKVAREVTASWKSPKSALEILSETRR
jgi:hypothetical protein